MALVTPSSAAAISDDKSLTDPTWYRFFTDLTRLVLGKYDTADISSGRQAALAQTPTGSYTPTLTEVTNLSASTAYLTYYIRIGAQVFLFGRFDADAVSSGSAATELGMSLPDASNFANLSEAGGVAATASLAMQAAISADTSNERLRIRWESLTTANATFSFSAGYTII